MPWVAVVYRPACIFDGLNHECRPGFLNRVYRLSGTLPENLAQAFLTQLHLGQLNSGNLLLGPRPPSNIKNFHNTGEIFSMRSEPVITQFAR